MSPGGHFSGVSNCYVFKSRLQEYAQKAGIPTPVYETVKEGPSHEPSFRSTVIVNNVRYDSLPGFFNRKAAEQSAAEIAFMEILKSGNMSEYISHPVHETGLCKNLLQEYAQKMNYAIPSYTTMKQATSGKLPFSCTVEIGGIQYIGAAARTKKEAEIKAARTALLAIQSSTGKSGRKQEGGYAYTVLPCKKKGRDSETQSEAAKPLKPRKAGFKKKWSKRRFHRIKSDRSKPIQSQQEYANGEDSLAGPENYFQVLKAVLTSQEGQIESSVDIPIEQASTNMQDSQGGQTKSKNENFFVSHWGFNSNQNGAIPNMETTCNTHVMERILDTTASSASEDGRVETPNYQSIYKDITMVSEVNNVSNDAGAGLVFPSLSMIALEASEGKEIHVVPTQVEGRNWQKQQCEPVELEHAKLEGGCESKFPAKYHEFSVVERAEEVVKIHGSAQLSNPIADGDGGANSQDLGYDKQVILQSPSGPSAIVPVRDAGMSSSTTEYLKQMTLQKPVGTSNQVPVGEAGVNSSGTEHVNQVLLQVPVGPSEQVSVWNANVNSSGTKYVKPVEEIQIHSDLSQSIVVEEAAMSISSCCQEHY